MRIIKLLVLLLGVTAYAGAQTAKESAFAAYLLQTGQYELAAFEFERLRFHYPQNDSLSLYLVRAHRLNGKFDLALQQAQQKQNALTKPSMAWAFQNEKNYNAILLQAANQLQTFAMESKQMAEAEREKYITKQLLLGNAILSGKTDLPDYEPGMAFDGILIQLHQDWQNRKQKSPALAATFSALLPGSGKVYAGAWKDGLVNALFVGANAYTTYRGFRNQGLNSPYVWIFGGLTTGFYLGNIYGAHKQAKKYNAQIDHEIRKRTYARLLDFHR
jgi:hypothetical protein